MSIVVGVDPGKSGAIAVLSYELMIPSSVKILATYKMPIDPTNDKVVDFMALARLFRTFDDASFCVERITGGHSPTANVHQSPTAQFNFGRSYAAVLHAIAINGKKPTLVMPVVWKRAAGLIKQPKSASKAMALELWPSSKRWLGTPDLAEACLIARHFALMIG